MDPFEPERQGTPSKSQRKRDAHALQKLGEELTQCSSAQLQRLPLTQEVITAIQEFQRLPNSHGAKKRQLQFIGRMMRECDLDEVKSALTAIRQGEKKPNSDKQLATSVAQTLIDSGGDGIETILANWPGLNRQRLRQLHRAFSKASEGDRSKLKAKMVNYLQENMGPESS